MSKSYANPLFGVEQIDSLGPVALTGTYAAKNSDGMAFKRASVVNDIALVFVGGGTAATKTITFNKSLAGTGALVAIGTAVLGTSADNTVSFTGITGTFAAGDVLMTQIMGTDAITYNVKMCIYYNEQFVNA